ncbi:MAG: ABC transporter substrate-binding protein [Spirochaetales bacterium]|nr:ABC transporter substrate-binding protein [Spirochaetales bacterium]
MKKLISLLLVLAIAVSFCFASGAAEAKAPAAQVEYKDTAIIGFQTKTSTTNPTANTSVMHRLFFNLTHDTLIDYDEATSSLKPGLATEWKASDDFKVWTFTLRDNVYFHNGEKFTADDVLFTWEFAKDNASNATIKTTYNKIESVKVIDDTHVELTLKTGDIDFLYTFSSENYSVLNREAVTADAENGPAIGTGPYMNDEFVVSDHTTLQRWDKYWGELAPTKTLQFRFIQDATTRLAALEAGEIDVCQGPNNTEHSIIRTMDGIELYVCPGMNLTYLAFNAENPALADPNLRLAIAYAINNQEIIDGAASGVGSVSNGMWGFFMYGYYDDWAAAGQSAYQPQNIEKAKEYLAKSNYPNGGLTIKMTCNSQWTVGALQIIQAQLKAININVEVQQLDSAGFTSLTKAKEHEVVITSTALTGAAGDAAKFFTPGNSANTASYDNEKVTELFKLAGVEKDDAKRKDYYKQIQLIIHEECPYIPLYYAGTGVAYSKKVSGAVWNGSGKFDYSQVKVEK